MEFSQTRGRLSAGTGWEQGSGVNPANSPEVQLSWSCSDTGLSNHMQLHKIIIVYQRQVSQTKPLLSLLPRYLIFLFIVSIPKTHLPHLSLHRIEKFEINHDKWTDFCVSGTVLFFLCHI